MVVSECKLLKYNDDGGGSNLLVMRYHEMVCGMSSAPLITGVGLGCSNWALYHYP